MKKKKKKKFQLREDLRDVVMDTLNGKYGNGFERRENLERAGYDYNEVQKALNQYIINYEPVAEHKKKGFFRKLFNR